MRRLPPNRSTSSGVIDAIKNKLCSTPVLAYPEMEAPFILETGASCVEVGIFLDQKKWDGRIYPVQYASCTMPAAERRYSTCQPEDLAVIFGINMFRLYLLSSHSFSLKKNHQALNYALQKKDVNCSLHRWLDFQAEYEFTIEYNPGSLNSAADFLSRFATTSFGNQRRRPWTGFG